MSLDDVREAWGLDDDMTPEEFADIAYGAKFSRYATDGPGYAGPLYVIEGGALEVPLLIIRNRGELVVVADEDE